MIAEIEFDPIATTYKEFCYNQEIKFNIKNMVKEMEHYKNIISNFEEVLYWKLDMTITIMMKSFLLKYNMNLTLQIR